MIELDEFIYIGSKIYDNIYEIPKEDLDNYNKFKLKIFDNQEKINKIKDMIKIYDRKLEFNMLGTVEIKSINKRLKDIIE